MSRCATALCTSAALFMVQAGAPALADSGLPGSAPSGTEINPRDQMPDPPRDLDGLSLLSDVTRTPTGLLYPVPFLYPPMTQSKIDPDWWSSGWIDAGLLGSFGNTGSARFREYGDWSNGFALSGFGFSAENRKTALYVSAQAQNVGQNDQTYRAGIGRYGVFDLTIFFDSTPHFYSTLAKSLWDGIGTGNLTLKDGLSPGASTAAAVNAALANTTPSDLRIERDKAGLIFKYRFDDAFDAVIQVSNEWRNGTQPFGATFGYPFQDGATQIVQPIHYRTLDLTGTLRYRGEQTQANLTYTSSIFRNDLQSLTWQNPGLTTPLPLGRLSLPPGNEYYSFRGDFATALTPDMRFIASLTYSLMRQNDSLLPPTVNSGIIHGVATAIDLSQWNTTAALSQRTAHAAINTFRAFAQFEYTPLPGLTLNFTLRDNSEDNLTNYVAFNPLTGQYGYIAIDGGLSFFIPRLSGVYEPDVPGSVVQIRNTPFANDNLELSANAGYRVTSHLNLDVAYTHNEIRHSAREVPDASDNRARIQLVSSGNSWGTIRASYEFGSLSGSDYTSNPYTPYYSTALPGYQPLLPGGDEPFTLSDLRKFDVGDRTEHKLRLQSNFILSPKTDLQFTGSFSSDNYDAQYGLRASDDFDFNTAFAYQISLATTFSAYYSLQFQNRAIANINALGGSTNAMAGGPAYPLSNAWYEKSHSLDHTVGATLHQGFDTVSIDLSYNYTVSHSALRYTFASTGAFFDSLTPTEAGTQFPDSVFRYHVFEGNIRWRYSAALAIRFYYRFDYQDLEDFHYTGLTAGVISNNVYLGVVPENYTAQVFGTFLQYTF